MRILFLAKFYTPYDRGGSEWSTRDLAFLLTKYGHTVTVLTPNYGGNAKEIIDGVEIIRIPFPIKLRNPKSSIAPFWTNNFIWFIYSSLFCIYICVKNKYEIIHVQNNEFIPSAVTAGKVLKKRTITTFRDYQIICNLGFCLWQNNKSCSLRNYLRKDFMFFYENYVEDKNVIKKCFLIMAVLRSRVMEKVIFEFAKRIDYKIAVSKKVKDIFEINGINIFKIIHNPVIVERNNTKKYVDKIVYVGKLSKGKGADMFVETIPDLILQLNRLSFEIIGSGHLREKLVKFVKSNSIESKVNIVGQLSHADVLAKVAQAALVVVPSIWPEPLPRSVIETILSGTPVVATNVGGVGEVFKNGSYGILTKAEQASLKKGIISAYGKKEELRKNIQKDIYKLRTHFTTDTVKSYMKIYKEALR